MSKSTLFRLFLLLFLAHPVRADWPWDGQRVPAHSTPAFAATAYHLQSRVLIIQFRNQAFYRYRDVPPELYDRLLASDFKGREFHRSIRGKFPTERLDRADWPDPAHAPTGCPTAPTPPSPEQADLFLLPANPNQPPPENHHELSQSRLRQR